MNDHADTHIVLIEDETDIAQMVAFALSRAGMRSSHAANGQAGLALLQHGADAVILDVGLPDMDGFEVLKAIRKHRDLPVLMLTAQNEEIDRILGLELGADDYIGKPFSPREVVARVSAVLRRPRLSRATSPEESAEKRQFGDVVIDPGLREVWVGDRRLSLTRTEFDILDVLSSNPRATLTRRQIIDRVWNTEWVGDDHVVNVHIANLRRKLGDDPIEPLYLLTVRGVGYRMGRPEAPPK